MYIFYNPNPLGKIVGDCVVRAITKATGQDWDAVYLGLMMQGYALKDMPSTNYVWAKYLKGQGFTRHAIPNICPDCYTVEDFCREHPQGNYLLATDSHLIAVVDGDWYDTWDSADAVPMYYFGKDD